MWMMIDDVSILFQISLSSVRRSLCGLGVLRTIQKRNIHLSLYWTMSFMKNTIEITTSIATALASQKTGFVITIQVSCYYKSGLLLLLEKI